MTERGSRNATPIERLVRPFQDFAQIEASSGFLLIGCTVAALLWANSALGASYSHFWHTKLTVGFGGARLSESLHFWINDGLMALFFFLVGLEIKREILVGELASFQRAALPIAAAIGGMLVPAALYSLFNHNRPGAAGWGIPMATDIAFALGVLALLGDRAPVTLKIFLAALAIADDIGAVLVIAFFYTATISWGSLLVAGLILLTLFVLNWTGARHPLVYIFLGIALWIAILNSGIHATVAGVLLAMTIPARQRLSTPELISRAGDLLDQFRSAESERDPSEAGSTRSAVLHQLRDVAENAEPVMVRFEHALTPWIKNLVMPVFALANAGVILGRDAVHALSDPVSLGIIGGLVLGKPIGIVGFSWLTTRLGISTLPNNVSWRQVIGISFLGGIGFTMSLFIADLAFAAMPVLETAKVGILVASVVAGLAGVVLLLKRNR